MFYSYYLRPAARKIYDPPGTWALSLDVDDIGKSLPDALRERPLSFFSDQSLDLLTAQTCLEYIHAKVTKHRSKAQAQKFYSDARVGSHVLAWLHRHYDHVDLSSVAGLGFLKILIHIALPQDDCERHIWGLLENGRAPKVVSSQHIQQRVTWRALALRALIESQAYWGEGSEGFDRALRSFARAWKSDDARRKDVRSSIESIPMASAAVWISKELLHKGASSIADVKLYEDFIAKVPRWRKDPLERELCVVRLLRVHPSKPDALPSFNFLQQCVALRPRPEFVRRLLRSSIGYTLIRESARALDQAGHHVEARQMLNVGRAEMPDFFDMTAFVNDYDDTSSQDLTVMRSPEAEHYRLLERARQREVCFRPWRKDRE